VDDRTDVQTRGLPEVAGLAAVVTRDRDDQVAAVDDHLGAGHAEPVHARGDDLLRLQQGLTGGLRAVGCARSQGHPGAALQVDAQFRLGPLVPGQEHQQVSADEQNQE
jgi:hypothetical protein